jgi:capsular polysaccharide biosynthesis protein
VVAIVIAVAILVTQPTSYRATTLVQVEVPLPHTATAKDLAAASTYANYRTVTFKALATSDSILDPVVQGLHLGISPRDLADHVSAVAAQDTDIIEVRVMWPTAQKSADIANAIAEQMVDAFPSSNDSVKIDLVQVTPASAAGSPVVPNPAETIGLAVFAALVVSSAWLFIRRIRRGPSAATEE